MLLLANKTEAQRLLSVLENAAQKLACLSGLPFPSPSVSFTADAFISPPEHYKKSLPPHVASIFHKQWQQEVAFLSSCGANDNNAHLSDDEDAKLHRLYHTTRTLARALDRSGHTHPEVPQSTTSQAFATFLETLHEWKESLTHTCSTTLQDDLRCAMTFGGLMDKEKLALETASSLRQTSQIKFKEWAKEKAALHALLEGLQAEVALWRDKTAQEEAAIAQQTEAALVLTTAHHEKVKAQLTEAITALVSALQNQTQVYKQAEDQAKEEQCQVEGELNALLQHYETTVQQKEEELARLQAIARTEREEFEELQEHFAIVESQQAELRQIEEVRQQRIREEQARLRHIATAAVRIQAMYRGYKAWTAFKKDKVTKSDVKAKGKKKGGGKAAKKDGAGKGGDAETTKKGDPATKKTPIATKTDKKAGGTGGSANKKK